MPAVVPRASHFNTILCCQGLDGRTEALSFQRRQCRSRAHCSMFIQDGCNCGCGPVAAELHSRCPEQGCTATLLRLLGARKLHQSCHRRLADLVTRDCISGGCCYQSTSGYRLAHRQLQLTLDRCLDVRTPPVWEGGASFRRSFMPADIHSYLFVWKSNRHLHARDGSVLTEVALAKLICTCVSRSAASLAASTRIYKWPTSSVAAPLAMQVRPKDAVGSAAGGAGGSRACSPPTACRTAASADGGYLRQHCQQSSDQTSGDKVCSRM